MANVRNLLDPANKFPDDTGFFRFRTQGAAIAPFLIVDEAATVFASLGGFGGRRLNLWFFGIAKWWSLKMYWAVWNCEPEYRLWNDAGELIVRRG